MASLNSNNVALNFKGILNLGSTINTPLSTTLQAITDGDGVASPLQLGTTLVAVTSSILHDWNSTPTGVAGKTSMWFDASGRMAWRLGTGASSYIRTFDATGITADRVYTLPNATTTLAGLAVAQTFSQAQNITPPQLTGSSATSSLTIVQDGNTTGNPTVLDVDLTGTTGSTSNLFNFKSAGTSICRLSKTTLFAPNVITIMNNSGGLAFSLYGAGSTQRLGVGSGIGDVTLRGTSAIPTTYSVISLNTNEAFTQTSGDRGLIWIQNTSTTGGNGNTGGFAPASGSQTHYFLKISSVINQHPSCTGVSQGILLSPTLTNAIDFTGIDLQYTGTNIKIGRNIGNSALTITSTTQGFTPPVMTTTQKNAIASPTAGLVVYDSTLNKLCVYTTAWETVTSI